MDKKESIHYSRKKLGKVLHPEIYKTIAEDADWNWIEEYYEDDGSPDFYTIYIAECQMSFSVCPKCFEKLKILFASAKPREVK